MLGQPDVVLAKSASRSGRERQYGVRNRNRLLIAYSSGSEAHQITTNVIYRVDRAVDGASALVALAASATVSPDDVPPAALRVGSLTSKSAAPTPTRADRGWLHGLRP